MPRKRNALPSTPRPSQKVRFGPVTTINTAPVSIGNSLRGTPTKTVSLPDGVRVFGRDLAFSALSTVAAATNWQPIGGMPLTPACLPSTILRNFVQMYNKFRINRIDIHYITSSATTQTGDIMFYYEKDRLAPYPDFTNNSFLPFVLSDSNTIIGPQWTNHSITCKPSDNFNSTNYGINVDINDDSAGSIFLLSKTSSANSPGYIVIDYDITFKELSVNPRAGILPVSRIQFNYLTLGLTATAKTAGNTFYTSVQGNMPDGTASAAPTGTTDGDVFKAIALVTHSTVSGVNAAWTNTTTANLLAYNQGLSGSGSKTTAITLDDGFTCYLVYTSSGVVAYPSIENAVTSSNPLAFNVTATITFNLCFLISLVTSTSSFLQSAY